MPKNIHEYKSPKIAVDAILFIQNDIVLIERKNAPHGWALPGGFVDYGESLEDAIIREVKEETSLDIVIPTLKQFHAYSKPDRDPRGHVISVVFGADADGVLKAQDDAKNIQLHPIDGLGNLKLAFDHQKIIDDYVLKKTWGIEKNIKRHKVAVKEYERGWGNNVLYFKYFEEEQDAYEYIAEFNSRNTAPIAPDYYQQAEYIGWF